MYRSRVSSPTKGPRIGRASWLIAGLTLLANPLLAAADDLPGGARERTAQRSSSSSSARSGSSSASRGSSSRSSGTRSTSSGSSSGGSRSTQSRTSGGSRGSRAPRGREGFSNGQRYRSDQSRGDHSSRGSSREGGNSAHHSGGHTGTHGSHGYHGSRHYRGYRYGHRPYYGHYYPFGWGIGYYGGYGYSRYGYGSGYFGYCGPFRYPYYPYPTQYHEGKTLGGMDLNVKPKDAAVYLNGSPIGKVGKYDGYPRYLWLEEGKYEVIFYLEGYETIKRELSVIPGVVLDINHLMTPGISEDPEEISAIDPEELRWVDENGQEVAEAKGEWWRKAPYLGQANEQRPSSAAPTPGPNGSLDFRQKPGTVRLSVVPSDASIYLDGQFVGTGSKISGLDSGLLVDAGKHVIEVVHPSYQRKELHFEVGAGDEIELKVGMEAKKPNHSGIEARL